MRLPLLGIQISVMLPLRVPRILHNLVEGLQIAFVSLIASLHAHRRLLAQRGLKTSRSVPIFSVWRLRFLLRARLRGGHHVTNAPMFRQ